MSKFPSIKNVLKATFKTVLRFPLEVTAAILGTIFAILLDNAEYDNPLKELFIKAILSSSLCFVLFISVSLYFVTSQKNSLLRFATSLLLGALLVAFVFNFDKEITTLQTQQFLVLSICLHLLVSFAAFLPKKYNQNEFWEFNKQLFLRILTASLYSIVLYSGLALALFAVKELFQVPFPNEIFAYLFYVIAGIFNSIFFLNGIPLIKNDTEPLQLKYPNGLKNFTQFILLPLISLYLIILIGYEVQIILTFSLPIGWVSYLVLIFAIFGILSFLLVYPIASNVGNLWMRTFNRWFYFLLIPLLGLLFWAIIYRISLYGVTPERFYVLLLSIWLAFVVAYFLIQKEPKIKFIPISMCIAGLLSIIGPQSASSVSKNSQLNRYESYIKKTEKEKLNFNQEKDLSSIVNFLDKNYDANILIIPQTKDKLTNLFQKNKNPSSTEIMEALGLEYHSEYATENDVRNNFYYSFYENSDSTVENISGYDMALTVTNYSEFNCTDCIAINKINYSIKSTKSKYGLDLHLNNDVIPLKIFEFINNNLVFDQEGSDKKRITQVVDHSKYQISIQYINLNGTRNSTKKSINTYSLRILVKVKK